MEGFIMKKIYILLTAVLQIVLAAFFAFFYQVDSLSYFIYAAAAIVQFALLYQYKLGYFFGFTVIYALLSVAFFHEYNSFSGYLSELIGFFLIALFTFLIFNMIKAEPYERLYFGTFILWIIAFGAIYAGLEFINVMLLKLEAMPARTEIASVFTNRMKIGIVMGMGLGLGYDIIKLTGRLKGDF
jgi:hypothetical protein